MFHTICGKKNSETGTYFPYPDRPARNTAPPLTGRGRR
nr:MAG TPA: hypothetical protein [Caudoviricetes sp.]